jgi:hypothetical protein
MKQIKLFLILALILFFTNIENRLNKKNKKFNMKKIQIKKKEDVDFIEKIKEYK